MKNRLFILVIAFSALQAFAQVPEAPRAEEKPIIESVDVSGVPENRMTSELRAAMQALVGQRFDQIAADEVGFRIQTEISQRIYSIRQLPNSMPGRVKVLFEFGSGPVEGDRRSRRGIQIDRGGYD